MIGGAVKQYYREECSTTHNCIHYKRGCQPKTTDALKNTGSHSKPFVSEPSSLSVALPCFTLRTRATQPWPSLSWHSSVGYMVAGTSTFRPARRLSTNGAARSSQASPAQSTPPCQRVRRHNCSRTRSWSWTSSSVRWAMDGHGKCCSSPRPLACLSHRWRWLKQPKESDPNLREVCRSQASASCELRAVAGVGELWPLRSAPQRKPLQAGH